MAKALDGLVPSVKGDLEVGQKMHATYNQTLLRILFPPPEP